MGSDVTRFERALVRARERLALVPVEWGESRSHVDRLVLRCRRVGRERLVALCERNLAHARIRELEAALERVRDYARKGRARLCDLDAQDVLDLLP